MADLTSVKVTNESKQHLKLIAAKKQEKFYETIARLAKREARRLKVA